MPSRRTLVAIAAGSVVVLLGLGVAGYVLSRDSATSATGDLIAYGCKERKNPWYAICSIGSDGTDSQRLTEKLETTDPAWSPDGRRIAFTRNEEIGESTPFTSDDVFVMDADGSDERRLTPERAGRSSGQPTWSPDGEQVAYVHGPSVSSAVPSRFGGLFAITDDGSDTRRLTQGRADTDPDWSPDGREIVFVRGVDLASFTNAADDVYVLDVASGATRRLTQSPPGVFEAAPAWSPDGSQIAFVRVTSATQFDGKASIHVINSDGTSEKLLLANKLFAHRSRASLAWSSDGRTLAFETSSMLGCTSISVLEIASGAIRPLTSCSRPIESTVTPTWQPTAAPRG